MEAEVQQRVLRAVAEQLKVPLLQIAAEAELSPTGLVASATALVSNRSTVALQLLDSYLLGMDLFQRQALLELEPVSVSSVLYDTAHLLDQSAQYYGVPLELHIAGKYGPVMAHARGLQAALVALGNTCIEAHAAADGERTLRLVSFKSGTGIKLGLYGLSLDFHAQALSRGRQLYGHARQPLQGMSASSGAGVFVADMILAAMSSRLHSARYRTEHGLAALLQPSNQLSLV